MALVLAQGSTLVRAEETSTLKSLEAIFESLGCFEGTSRKLLSYGWLSKLWCLLGYPRY